METPIKKPGLHPRNYHNTRYNFPELIASFPELANYVKVNQYGDESVNFFNTQAVLALNKALLIHFYKIPYWDIPAGYLCPPIPGRADYIHYIADLLGSCNNGVVPKGGKIKCLDIGVGASGIYPIIGNKVYGWSFVGSDIDATALDSAGKIIEKDPKLKENVELRLQTDSHKIFQQIIQPEERFDICICNPPFHTSYSEAQSLTNRKLSNLKGKRITNGSMNFGGKNNELWCEGGEERFIDDMIRESSEMPTSCFWFTTLVSKQSHLGKIYSSLEKAGTTEVKTILMNQGHKTSRIVAWTYFTPKQQEAWKKTKS
jgi:23S rRNA (adenine1618-N6)-methyltransferase